MINEIYHSIITLIRMPFIKMGLLYEEKSLIDYMREQANKKPEYKLNELQEAAIKAGLDYKDAIQFQEDWNYEIKDPLLEAAIYKLNQIDIKAIEKCNYNSNYTLDSEKCAYLNQHNPPYPTKTEALKLGYSYQGAAKMPSNLQVMLIRKGVPYNIAKTFTNHWQIEALRSGATYEEAVAEKTQLHLKRNCDLHIKIIELYRGSHDDYYRMEIEKFIAIPECPSDQDVQRLYEVAIDNPLRYMDETYVNSRNYLGQKIIDMNDFLLFETRNLFIKHPILRKKTCHFRENLQKLYDYINNFKATIEPGAVTKYLVYNFMTDVIENYLKSDSWEEPCQIAGEHVVASLVQE